MPTDLMAPNLNLVDAATRLGCSQHTLRKWMRQGRIAHVRLGTKIFFTQRDLVDFVERSRVPARDEAGR